METILVAGGAGYIGSHTAYELEKAGYNVIILDNFSEGHREFVKDYKVCEVDLADLDGIRKVFAQNTFALLFYQKKGFKIIAETPNPQTGETEVLMAWSKGCLTGHHKRHSGDS